VLNRIENLSRLGLHKGLSYVQARNVVLVNKTIMFLSFAGSIRLGLDLFQQNFFNAVFSITMVLVPILALMVNHFRKPVFSSILLCAYLTVFITIKKMVYGVNGGAEFGFLLLFVYTLLILENKKHKYIGLTIVFLGYLFACIYETKFGPIKYLTPGNEIYYFIFFAASTMSVWVFSELTQDNYDYSEKQRQLLSDLECKQKEIKQQNEKLEHINQNLEKFAYQTSHDIKAPLKNINSFIGLMSQSVEKYDDKQLNQFVKIIEENSKGLERMVEEILAFAKMEVGKIQRTNVNLQEVIEEVKFNLSHTLQTKKAQVESGLLSNIYANHSLMIILFQNLIENGLKYNESENPGVKISQKHTAEKKIMIIVEDNGIGISPEFKEKIFEMFVRLDHGNKFTGTGIGLSTCKNIANQLDGDLTFDSNPDGGTRFILTFPQSIMIPKKVKVKLSGQSVGIGSKA